MRKSLLIVSALSVFLGGCSVAQKAVNQVTDTAEQKAVEQAVRATCKYDQDVCEYFVASSKMMQTAVTMKTTMTSKEKTLNGTTTITKMDGKSNMDSVSSKDGKETSRMIVFNNATYTKNPDENVWYKMSSGDQEDTSIFNTKKMMEDMQETFSEDNEKLSVKKIGQEACGSLTCVIYEMVDETNKEFGTTKTWIDTKEHLARKVEVVSEYGTSTIEYTYGPVTITEPSPVKEFTMPNVEGLKNGQMPSTEDIQKMMKDLPQTEGEFGDGE